MPIWALAGVFSGTRDGSGDSHGGGPTQSQSGNLLVLGLRSWAMGLRIHLRPPTLFGAPALALGRPSPQSPASSSPLFPCARGKCLRQGDRGSGGHLHSLSLCVYGQATSPICESGHSSHLLLAEGSREILLKTRSECSSLIGAWNRLPGLVGGPDPCAWAVFLPVHQQGPLRIQPLSSELVSV